MLSGATYKAARLETILKRSLPRLAASDAMVTALCGSVSEDQLSMLDRRTIQVTSQPRSCRAMVSA